MKSFYGSRFTGIQVLRGIAILCILLKHVRFIGRGEFGVDIFFCISGFAMMLSTHGGWSHYWKKRLTRILPLYSVMTLGTFLLLVLFPGMFENTTARWDQLFYSLFYVPFHMADGTVAPILRVGWTINLIMYFYLVFYVALRLSHRFRGLIASCILILVVAAQYILVLDQAALQLYGSPVVLNFVLGMALYPVCHQLYYMLGTAEESEGSTKTAKVPEQTKRKEIRRRSYLSDNRGPDPKKEKRRQLAAWISLAVAVAMLTLMFLQGDSLWMLLLRTRLPLWEIPAAILVLCFFVMGQVWQMPKPLIRLGDVSYALCLVHYYPLLFLDRKVFDFSALTPLSLVGALLGIALSITLAYAAWRLIEQPCVKLMKKRIASK